MFSLQILIEFLNEHTWTIVEFSGILDDWTGLVDFDEVYKLIHEYESYLLNYESETGDPDHPTIGNLEATLKIDTVLKQLTDRFLSSCRYASESSELRQTPALVILPAPQQSVTAIGGIVFKLDEAGKTFLCYPRRYGRFWNEWFKLQDETIAGIRYSRKKSNTISQPAPIAEDGSPAP